MSRVFFTDRDLGKRFPELLAAAGLDVRRHADYFPPDCPDETWLPDIGKRGWIAITHDSRIRYKPNELAAVTENRVGLPVVIGHAPYAQLAQSFIRTRKRIEAFLDQHQPPFIAKVYRPTPGEISRNTEAPGRIELWYPR